MQETRESLGVRLEGNVVVVDEAHNLVDAVNNVHSALITAQQLATAHSALESYYQRFRALLALGTPCDETCPHQAHACLIDEVNGWKRESMRGVIPVQGTASTSRPSCAWHQRFRSAGTDPVELREQGCTRSTTSSFPWNWTT